MGSCLIRSVNFMQYTLGVCVSQTWRGRLMLSPPPPPPPPPPQKSLEGIPINSSQPTDLLLRSNNKRWLFAFTIRCCFLFYSVYSMNVLIVCHSNSGYGPRPLRPRRNRWAACVSMQSFLTTDRPFDYWLTAQVSACPGKVV